MTHQPLQHSPISSSPVAMSQAVRDQLLLDWREAKENLDAAKEAELDLRNRIVSESGLFDADKEEGTQTVELGSGWKVKAVKKLNWKVFQSIDGLAHTLDDAIDAIEQSAGKMAADEIIKFDPRLSVGTYKKLSATEKSLIDPFLQHSPATPSLELVPPKK